MVIYGLLILAVGLSLMACLVGLAAGLHRRFHVPYALLTVGAITYILSLLAQALVLQLVDRALLGILPIGALALGVAAGFTEETGRLLGYQFLAPGAVTRPQALMIGAGHGAIEALYTALVSVGIGGSLIGSGAERPDDLAALLGGGLAEALNGLLPLIMHLALSWIVLQVFLRGQLYWLFLAIFCHVVIEIMAALLGPGDAWAVVGWRALVALFSLAVIARLRPPNPT